MRLRFLRESSVSITAASHTAPPWRWRNHWGWSAGTQKWAVPRASASSTSSLPRKVLLNNRPGVASGTTCPDTWWPPGLSFLMEKNKKCSSMHALICGRITCQAPPTWVWDSSKSDYLREEDSKGPDIWLDAKSPKVNGLWSRPLDGKLCTCVRKKSFAYIILLESKYNPQSMFKMWQLNNVMVKHHEVI